MPAEYNKSKNFLLRMLTGKSSVHEIGTGFQSLGEDVDKTLTEMGEKSVDSRALIKTGNAYSALAAHAESTPVSPSATRTAIVYVTFVAKNGGGFNVELLVGGVLMAKIEGEGVRYDSCLPLWVAPGVTWEWKTLGEYPKEALVSQTLL